MDPVPSTDDQNQSDENFARARILGSAGVTILQQFRPTDPLSDLEEAMSKLQEALSLSPDDHVDRPAHFNNLAVAFTYRFMRAGTMSDLEEAIKAKQQAISLTPDDHPDKPNYLSSIGSSFSIRFECLGMLGDLDEAIKNEQQAVSLTPDDHSDKPEYLSSLGISFAKRFGRTGMLSDLEESVKHQRQAVSLTPDGHPDQPMYLTNLGIALESRFESTGTLSDLEEAIKVQRQALSLTPDGHSDKPRCFNNLGDSLESRFTRTGTLSDLEEAIKNKQQAVLLTPDGHSSKPLRLSSLGNSLESRFRHTGTLSDIEEAIENQQKAVSLTPDGNSNKPKYLTNVGNSFHTRFEHKGILSDLEDAIESHKQAISLTPDGHPDKPRQLNNLANSLESRFGYTGTLSDLEDAIKSLQQAVLLVPEGHAARPIYFCNLGNSFQSRFRHTGTLSDLGEAIKNKQRAVSLAPDGHPGRPMFFGSLGNSFQSRFEHTKVPSDLEEAIKSQHQAVLLTPDGHPSKPVYLSNLGASFLYLFGLTGVLNSIEMAIKTLQWAVLLTPDTHPNKSMYLSNLGNCFQDRFKHTETLEDIEEAIKLQRQAVLLTPEGHPGKTGQLYHLGNFFQTRFDHTGSPNDLEEAISNLQSAATSNVGSISLRSRASLRWARLEAKRDTPSALAAYGHTIKLLPQTAWIGDSIATRHSLLSNFGDVSREAAALALELGHPDLALEWLEQGRSVVWNQLLNLRTPVDDLRQAHPDICSEFTEISYELQGAATRGHAMKASDAVSISFEEETQRHHRLAEKWDSLVEKIRSLPGFEDFLLPKKASTLTRAASSGPVVIINVHQRRCDALVLEQSKDHVLHIPLDKLRYEDVIKMGELLDKDLTENGYRGAEGTGGSRRLSGILSKLYSSTVEPILTGLNLMTGDGHDPSNLPRIWWCPTGPLTFLPLHAACRGTGSTIDGTFNYVVSSYTPTVNALLEARAVKQPPFTQLVGIAMKNTPGQSQLASVETEMEIIGNFFSNNSGWKFEILRNEQATGDQVLNYMTNSSWIHLACHAVQDEQEPTQSGFCLHDQRLTITDIIAKPFVHADFAFLSACETAAGDERASDEAVHITGAMLGAGYRNVIGTMWSIPDEVAPMIAAKTYEILLSEGEPNSDRAAQALHEAVKEVRESDHDFNYWVPFVHYGA